MSWKTELPVIVRTLINDLVEPYSFTEERILQTLVVAAKYVQFDVVLDHRYVSDVINVELDPDPTIDDDDIFIDLTCLKAACMIDQGTFRAKAAMEGIRAALGPAQLSVGGNADAWKIMLDEGPCGLYSSLVEHWDVANASAVRAILGPFSGNKFDPEFQYMRERYNYRNGFYS